MVDFSKPTNTADMVAGLNKLRHKNAAFSDYLKPRFLESLESEQSRDYLRDLKSLHDEQTLALEETMRMLGGAPDSNVSQHHPITQAKLFLERMQDDRKILQAVFNQERKLNAEYRSAIQDLKASPECVDVINRILDQRRDLLDWLKRNSSEAYPEENA